MQVIYIKLILQDHQLTKKFTFLTKRFLLLLDKRL